MLKKVICIVYIFSITNSFAQSVVSPAEKKIDSLFTKFNKSGLPGCMVGVIKDNAFLFKKGYGSANLEYNIPVTIGTNFNIASLSKQFTAACIALLILKNEISLEDNVKKYLPEFGKYKEEIKIKHLIYMTSGLKEYYDCPRKNGTDWSTLNYYSVDTAINATLSQPLQYKPGNEWTYSNVNYMVLTKIVEKVSGKRFSQFAKENIFDRLEMRNTVVNDDITQIIKRKASGYIERSVEEIEAITKAGYFVSNEGKYFQLGRNSPHYGGSGIYTSLNDLQKWDQNFYSHVVGGEAFYELMHKRITFNHKKDNDAFGLVFGKYKGTEMVWYSGSDAGFSSYMMRFPKQKITIICLSNLGSGNTEDYAHKLMDLLINEKMVSLD